jgi:hypothetical protein
MGRELKFMTCCPDDTYYTWQVHLWLESLKNIGKSQDAIVLLFIPHGRTHNSKWEQVKQLYPEVEFNVYLDDKDQISTEYIPKYIPILRPYMMWKYFTEHPEMSEKAIFYCDSDILFMPTFDVDKFKDDDVNYLSDTNSYINVDYFDGMWERALPEKQEEFKKLDVVAMMGALIGITREQAERFKEDSGGAQYLLKNLNAAYWFKVMKDCIVIRSYLQKINREFFKDENAGFQAWCADMWAVLWNLWFHEGFTKVIPEMAFAWATDPIEKLDVCPILHNAGITKQKMGEMEAFYKGVYHKGIDPTRDPHLNVVLEDETAKKHCTWYYANELLKLKNKYNLIY